MKPFTCKNPWLSRATRKFTLLLLIPALLLIGFSVKFNKTGDTFVNVKTLLATPAAHTDERYTEIIPINEHLAVYASEFSVSSNTLKHSIGTAMPGAHGWYKLSGHRDAQYLIRNSKGQYSLWKFQSFNSTEYPLHDVLQTVYDLYDPRQIERIIVTPSNIDNTDAGKALQQELGVVTITDPQVISQLYAILQGLTCYGEDNWDKIDLGTSTETGMLDSVRYVRYLHLTTVDGREIASLKYTAISSMFYEYNGIAYSALSAQDAQTVENLLHLAPYNS